jgi:hypothetical protein
LDPGDKGAWDLDIPSYWIPLIVFLPLVGISGWVLGKKAFQQRALNAAEVMDRRSPMDQPPEEVGSRGKRILAAIMDFV